MRIKGVDPEEELLVAIGMLQILYGLGHGAVAIAILFAAPILALAQIVGGFVELCHSCFGIIALGVAFKGIIFHKVFDLIVDQRIVFIEIIIRFMAVYEINFIEASCLDEFWKAHGGAVKNYACIDGPSPAQIGDGGIFH